MNYQGNEKMRQDAAEISNELYELWQKVKRFQREYSFNSENITDRLAGRLIGTMEPKLADLNSFMADVDYQFEIKGGNDERETDPREYDRSGPER
ncbi:hypothetical protein [Klebsiella pneumoniae]|uniref:hypothetical protein n=2 Tax=Gammaproteobacteria TaxID=1236 RepID=UPI001E3CB43A|nr:hypothetical protein [Klebsiella pneumoniae]